MDLPLASLERLLDSRVVDSEVAPTPGGPKNRTALVVLEDGRRLALQAYSDRRIARLRLRAAEQLAAPLREHGVPVPRVVVADLEATPPWAVFEALSGAPGYVAADHDLLVFEPHGDRYLRLASLDLLMSSRFFRPGGGRDSPRRLRFHPRSARRRGSPHTVG